MRLGVWVLGLRDWGLGFGNLCLDFRVGGGGQDLRMRLMRSVFRVWVDTHKLLHVGHFWGRGGSTFLFGL